MKQILIIVVVLALIGVAYIFVTKDKVTVTPDQTNESTERDNGQKLTPPALPE